MKRVVDITSALKKGDFVTVLERTGRDRSFIGSCLEILVIERPFVRVKLHGDRALPNRVMTVDLREVKLQRLSDEFVRSVIDEKA